MPAPPAALRRWVFPGPPDQARVDRLGAELRLPPALCRLLVQRGYGEPAAVRDFLRPHPGHIHPPLGLAGMDAAVERIVRAIRTGETVLVHGDYDVDGICSTALFVRALRMMGARAVAFVPHRLEDGYDLSDAGLRAAADAGATLILTGDCGIVAHEAVDRARAAGIDVIVTDHHTPGDTLPNAVAVVNPNRRDCAYPDKSLAGVGVAYKVCCAVADALGFSARAAARLPRPGGRRHHRRPGAAHRREPRAGALGAQDPAADAQPRPARADQGHRPAGEGRDQRLAGGLRAGPAHQRRGPHGRGAARRAPPAHRQPAEAEAIAAELESENRWRQTVDGQTLKEAMAALERTFDPERDYGVVLAARDGIRG